jgi:hypothetical protein
MLRPERHASLRLPDRAGSVGGEFLSLHRRLRGALLLVFALFLAALSGRAHQRLGSEYIRYEGVGPGLDSTRVVVGGWPAPFLYDKVGLSPGNSVSLSGALLGLDAFRPLPFLMDTAFYLALLLALARLLRLLRVD